MKNKKDNKRLLPLFICLATLFMSVGYAAINSISLNINGTSAAISQQGIFITDVLYVSSENTDVSLTQINDFYETTLNGRIVLSDEKGVSSIKYEVQIHNNTKDAYIFDGVKYVVGPTTYSNQNIIYELDGLIEGEALLGGQSTSIFITFKYLNDTVPESNILDCLLNFSFINGTDKISEPSLANNSLVPVKYNGETWVIIDKSDNWYDYNRGEWANAVLLEENSTKIVGDTITVDGTNPDIIGMFVWVPRYEYKIKSTYGTHINGTSGTSSLPGKIEVNFIDVDDTTATEGYTIHPAFTFNENNLTGFWVGKFETSASQSSTCYTAPTSDNCNNSDIKPYIIPNAISLRYQKVSTQYNTAANFSTYLTDSTNIDSHMMKNSEWGAVAYLAQSIYGKYGNENYTGANKEVYINNSSTLYTGRSGGTGDAGKNDDGTYQYNDGFDTQTISEEIEGTRKYLTVEENTNYQYVWRLKDNKYNSTNQGEANSTTNLAISFTLEEAGDLDFKWTVSSESETTDYFYYTITKDGTLIEQSNNIGGTSYGTEEDNLTYLEVSRELEAGSYVVEFMYIKNDSTDAGLDTAYVKDFIVSYGEEYTEKEIPSEKSGIGASTTGNIYGIYDMNGGTFEYVMGYLNGSNSTWGGNSSYNGAGFSSEPSSYYFDSYTSSTIGGECSGGVCMGHALSETNGWYNDSILALESANPWYIRGGVFDYGATGGIFSSSIANGDAGSYATFRMVLVDLN